MSSPLPLGLEGPGTPAYLTHVSVRAASHPLDELEVLLRVPPLNLAAWPGEDVHDGSNRAAPSHLVSLMNGGGGWLEEIDATHTARVRAPCPEAERKVSEYEQQPHVDYFIYPKSLKC